MEVAAGAPEEDPADAGQHRITQVTVQRRHGALGDAAGKAVAHHQLLAPAQFVQERAEVGEIIAVIGVPHDDKPPLGRGDAAGQRGAVAPGGDGHDPRPGRRRQGLRSVGAAVVRHQDLARHAVLVQPAPGLLHADGYGLRLVEARHHDAEFHGKGSHCHPPPGEATAFSARRTALGFRSFDPNPRPEGHASRSRPPRPPEPPG